MNPCSSSAVLDCLVDCVLQPCPSLFALPSVPGACNVGSPAPLDRGTFGVRGIDLATNVPVLVTHIGSASSLVLPVFAEEVSQPPQKRRRTKSKVGPGVAHHPKNASFPEGAAPPVGPRSSLCHLPFQPFVLEKVPSCSHCGAFKFPRETKNFCCMDGDICIAFNRVPATLKELLLSSSEEAIVFREYIRAINNNL